ncbi:MAG: hypothetical protein HYR96_08180 [Deltaproteobacteria bacterium]|nr:hypothetical protein [Deltaproteobacteria bacterium]MBI3293484.1 hypothetical protein [Deltaproteobacteria bacterium]
MRSYAIAVYATLVAAALSGGFHHYDEHFHVLEYLALKVGRTGPAQLPWEYGAQVRSWWLPGILYPFLRLEMALGLGGPLAWAATFRLLGGLLNLGVTYLLLTRWRGERVAAPLFSFLLCGLWFLPYVHVRTSIENWSGALFFLGLVLSRGGGGFLVGFLWGVAFAMRLQVAPMIAGAVAWWFWSEGRVAWPRVGRVLAGAVLAMGCGLLVDRWGYGVWTVPWANYLVDQFRHQRASTWGTSPPWYYFTESLLKAAPPISIFLVGGVILSWIWFPTSLFTWVTIPFVVAHTLEPHKELRFLFPMLYAVPFQVALVVERMGWRAKGVWWCLLWGLNLILMAAAVLRPAEGRVSLYRYLEKQKISSIRWVEDDPYELFRMPLNFYRPPDLQSAPVEYRAIPERMGKGERLNLVTSRFNLPIPLQSVCERRFSILPMELSRYNVLNWMDRTRIWTVYDCQK